MAVVNDARGSSRNSMSRPKTVPLGAAVVSLAFLALVIPFGARMPSLEAAGRSGARPPVEGASALPIGLILPVRMNDAFELRDARKGAVIETRIMQEVPLPDRQKIPMRAVLRGTILDVTREADGSGLSLTIAFNTLEDHKEILKINTSLRAMASYQAVRAAETPWTGVDVGTPASWANTVQIGGDIRYGDGGVVRNNRKQKVGKGVIGGVLVHVFANPNGGCEGPLNGDDHPQALWVFSADACGVYGMKQIKIAHAGRSDPLGQVTLHFAKQDAKLDAGTAMLLRVVEKP